MIYDMMACIEMYKCCCCCYSVNCYSRPTAFLYDFYSAFALLAVQTTVIAMAELSVCLSVRPSRADVLSRRIKTRSCGLQHRVGQ